MEFVCLELSWPLWVCGGVVKEIAGVLRPSICMKRGYTYRAEQFIVIVSTEQGNRTGARAHKVNKHNLPQYNMFRK